MKEVMGIDVSMGIGDWVKESRRADFVPRYGCSGDAVPVSAGGGIC